MKSEFSIAHIGPSTLSLPVLRGGAVQRRMLGLAAAQAKLTNRCVHVLGPGPSDGSVRTPPGVKMHYSGAPTHSSPARIKFLAWSWSVLRDIQPDVIHVHNRPDVALALGRSPFARTLLTRDYHLEPFTHVPIVRTVSKWISQQILTTYDAIAFVSEYSLQMHEEHWNLGGMNKAILPNGVDTAVFKIDEVARAAKRKQLGLTDRIVLLYVGRVCRQKGSDLLVAAFERLQRHYDGAISLVMAGPACSFERGDAPSAGGTAVDPSIKYLGPVQEGELSALYNAADLFVMPTRNLEMFGMAALEAQACGRPVIASDHGGLREFVNESNGDRFRNGDVDSLVAAIRPLIDDAALRRSKGYRAMQDAQQYSWTSVAEKSLSIYEGLRASKT